MSAAYSNERKNDLKILVSIMFGFVFIAWLCTPPGNKFLQTCFWGNNTKMFFASLTNDYKAKEYIYHRNNAVYLAKMYPKDKKKAIREMNMAIRTIPTYVHDSELQTLYRERAYIYIYIGDYKSALNDFLHSGDIKFEDYLKVALLLDINGNFKYAERFCNAILNTDVTAYAGYACLAEIYSNAGRPDIAVNVWNLALDRKNNYPKFLVERAKAKRLAGDEKGYDEDINSAKKLDKHVELDYSIIDDTLHPKKLLLNIR